MLIGKISDLDWLRMEGIEIPYCDLPMSEQGIYVIYNSINKHIYIGSTTISFSVRCKGHTTALNCKTHRNTHLLFAWNKYGKNAFRFIPFSLVEDIKQIFVIEQMWIDYFLYHNISLYNIEIDIEKSKIKWQQRRLVPMVIPPIVKPLWHGWVYGGQKRRQKGY